MKLFDIKTRYEGREIQSTAIVCVGRLVQGKIDTKNGFYVRLKLSIVNKLLSKVKISCPTNVMWMLRKSPTINSSHKLFLIKQH